MTEKAPRSQCKFRTQTHNNGATKTMASSADFDPAQLSPSQQEALQQYTQLTNQEPKDAIPLLERSQWNVQVSTASALPT